MQAMATGGFAERVVIDQSQIVKIPADMDKDAEPPLVPLPDGEPGDRV